MIMTVVRKYHKAYNRVREGNFLLDGLLGFNLHGKTIGLIGTGRIGLLTGKILAKGFGCTVIAYDPFPSPLAQEYGITYVEQLDELLERSDIVSLHCPLTKTTEYIINDDTLGKMKEGVILINTSRGGLIDTYALIRYVSSTLYLTYTGSTAHASYTAHSSRAMLPPLVWMSMNANLRISSRIRVQRSFTMTSLLVSCHSTMCS
jgi:lactate dehydrogenase-like 2-hydroxyacid dehydrogenase